MKTPVTTIANVSLVLAVLCSTAAATHIDFTDGAEYKASTHLKPEAVKDIALENGSTVQMTLAALPRYKDEGAVMTWNDGDGLGVKYSYEYDEIETPELLSIHFDKLVHLETIELTDLFYEKRDGAWYQEKGALTYNDGVSTQVLHFNSPDHVVSNGWMTIDLDTDILWMQFAAPGRISAGEKRQDHEYSVAGLQVNSVPEPATISTLALSLLSLAGLSVRRKKR